MRKIVLLIIALFSAWLLACCTKEPEFSVRPSAEGAPVSVRLQVHIPDQLVSTAPDSRQAGSAEENVIHTVRVIAFVSAGSTSTVFPSGSLVCNQVHPSAIPFIEQRLNSGIRDFYIIVNEPPSLTAQLQRVTSLGELQALRIGYDRQAPSAGHPFVMYASLLNQTISGSEQANGPQRLDVRVDRIAAKVRFRVTLDQTKVRPAILNKPLVIDSVKLFRVADAAHIVEAVAYTPSTALMSDARHVHTTPPADTKNWTFTDSLYLMERGFTDVSERADTTRATYLLFYADCGGMKCRYRINVGNQIKPADGSLDFTVTRNTLYDIKGTIVDMGETDGVDIQVKLLPWTTVQLTDNNGVTPVITKYIEDYSPCYGRGEFTVALSEDALWKVYIDNPYEFMLKGKTSNSGSGDLGGVFNVVPRSSLTTQSSTKIRIVINGQIVDESEVKANYNSTEYNIYQISSNGKVLLVFDRNLGASSPQSPGCLYKYGSRVGTHYMTPSFGITPSATDPIQTYQIQAWEKMGMRYHVSSQEINSATAWAGIPYLNGGESIGMADNPCPKGWRILQPADFTNIINTKFTNEAVTAYGPFTQGSVSGRILTDDNGDKQYFPVMHYRATTGVLSPNSKITAGYYWLNSGTVQQITPVGSSATTLAADNAAYVRCVGDPLTPKINRCIQAPRLSYKITIFSLMDKLWSIRVVGAGSSWMKLSESDEWGVGQVDYIEAIGNKDIYLQPMENSSNASRTFTLQMIYDGKVEGDYDITQSSFTSNVSTGVLNFASQNHSPGAGIATSHDDGALNTFQLCTMTDNPCIYSAAQFCYNLTVQELGHIPVSADEMIWYLPAINELMKLPCKGLEHSSTVNGIFTYQRLSSCSSFNPQSNMNNSYVVRCQRKTN